ncbi:MAG: hypothetical protein H0X34_04320 [Chthoniobacterales bacterium]|nr:hypothetical protein [Chthoniobacterales bacterium]
MDAFSYLSVLLSIILGLAITQLLQGLGRIIQARNRIEMFWPPIVWAALFILVIVQTWWSLFGLRTRENWSFFPFLVVVLQTINLYLTTALILPEIPAGIRVDLRKHYFAEARWFFSLTIVAVALSLGKDLVLNGSLPAFANTVIQLIFVGAALSAIVFQRPWYHKLLALVCLALFGLYIALLFTRLSSD